MKRFAFANASTVEEAVAALDEGCRPLAGGTDLIGLMKKGLTTPDKLVNLKTIPSLDGVERGDEGWRIGGLTTLARLAQDDLAGSGLGILREAALESASPQLRHAATLGGNLLQRPRCWYFRNPLTECWLKGGEACLAAKGANKYHAVFAAGPCHVVHPSDPAVALLALDARVTVVGPEGRRRLPVEGLFRMPRQGAWSETVVAANELITGIVVPDPPPDSRGAYVKVAERAVWDFALVSAAVQLVFADELIRQARVVLGGVAPQPHRAPATEEALMGQALTQETIDRAAEAAASGAQPLSQNSYKVELIRGVVAEALRRL